MSPLGKFKLALNNPKSQETYQFKLKHIFKLMEIPGSSLEEQSENFVKLAKKENGGVPWVREWLFAYIAKEKERIINGELRPGTLKSKFQSLKLFCEVNEEELGIEAMKWKTISRTLPPAKSYGDDKAYTVQDIRKLINNNREQRIKPLALVLASSGIRFGAWDNLRWKHVKPVYDNDKNGELLAAVLTVYDDEEGVDKHYSFITPEAFNAVQAWIDFRKLHGEKIDDESWIIRDTWRMTEITVGGQRGVAQDPKKLRERGLRKMMERALKRQGLRTKLPPGKRRYEVKEFHGFRKFFETQTALAKMDPKNINKLTNHHVNYEPNYYKPLQDDVLKDYLKAVPYLTVNDFEKSVLLQKVEVLEAEKDGKLERMQKQIEYLMEHAYVSEHGVEWYETLAKRIPSKELGKYMDEADLLDSDPEYGKFVFEDAEQGEREHKKYQEDVRAYGKQKLEQDFQRWKQEQEQQQEKRGLKQKEDDHDDNNS